MYPFELYLPSLAARSTTCDPQGPAAPLASRRPTPVARPAHALLAALAVLLLVAAGIGGAAASGAFAGRTPTHPVHGGPAATAPARA